MSIPRPESTPDPTFERINPADKEKNLQQQQAGEKAKVIADTRDAERGILNEVDRETSGMSLNVFLGLTEKERLTRITNPPVTESDAVNGRKIAFHFRGNRKLERHISLADVMPKGVLKVQTKLGEKVREGKRQGLSGEFFVSKGDQTGERLKILTGTEVTLLTVDRQAAETQARENRQKVETYLAKDLPPNIAKEEYENIVTQAIDKGIDPDFVLALRRTENGANGKVFGVMLDGIDTPELQLQMAIKLMGRYQGRFAREYPNRPIFVQGKYSPAFLAYFSNTYAPLGASNDPTNLNSNHLKNLVTLYAGGDQNYLEQGQKFLETRRNLKNPGHALDALLQKDLDAAYEAASRKAPALAAAVESFEGDPRLKNIDNLRLPAPDYDVYLECKHNPPFINANALADLITMALIYHTQTGEPLVLDNSYRTESQQAHLLKVNGPKGVPTAPVGESNHNTGHALDIDEESRYNASIGGVAGLRYIAQKCNFKPLASEDWHFDHVTSQKGAQRIALSEALNENVTS